MILAEAPSGKYWVIEATLTSAIEEKEKPSVINAALSAVEIEDFLVILVLLWLLFFSRRIIISSELNRVNHFLFLIDCGKVARRCRGFVFTKFQGKRMKQIPMTVRGAALLRQELDFLKNERRPEIIKAIAEAREHGDLKENAEYHAAREQQGFCEGRIQEIESKLANCQVIDVTKLPNNGKVIFGATVVLVNTDSDEEVTYQIVGDDEADIKSGLISVNSPIARGLIGKELDDTVNITTPGGTVEFEIIEVNYI